ncbi:hypothetical protein ACFV6F_21060 [Kitasatospora phosalacinea]|uniref:hypothetical protein n=1 Tax=Kitasatospora phosalacinea TaxID=2065 RepID=UPI0036691CF2
MTATRTPSSAAPESARLAGSDLPSSALRRPEHFAAAGPVRVPDVAECLRADVLGVAGGVVATTGEGRLRTARCGLPAGAFGATPPDRLGRAADVPGLVREHVPAASPAGGHPGAGA